MDFKRLSTRGGDPITFQFVPSQLGLDSTTDTLPLRDISIYLESLGKGIEIISN